MPSWWGEDAGRPIPGEDAGRLPDQVLEAQAKKLTQRAPVPQGVILKEEQREKRREKGKNDTGRPSFGERGPYFIFKRNFYTLTCT